MDIFVICVILVSFTPSGHTQGLQYGYWKLPSSFFLINLYQYFFIWLTYLWSEVQAFENGDNSNVVSIDIMA